MMMLTPQIQATIHPYLDVEMNFAGASGLSKDMQAMVDEILFGSRQGVLDQLYEVGLEYPVLLMSPDRALTVSTEALPRHVILAARGGRQAFVLLYPKKFDTSSGTDTVYRAVVAASTNETLVHLLSGLRSHPAVSRRTDAFYEGSFRTGRNDTPFVTLFLGAEVAVEGMTWSVRTNAVTLKFSHTDSDLVPVGPRAMAEIAAETDAVNGLRDTKDAEVLARGRGLFSFRVDGPATMRPVIARDLTPEMRNLAPALLNTRESEFIGQAFDLGLDRPCYIETRTFDREPQRTGHLPQHVVVLQAGDREGCLLLTPVKHRTGGDAYMATFVGGPEARLEIELRTRNKQGADGETVGAAPFKDSTVFVDSDTECRYLVGREGCLAIDFLGCADGQEYVPTAPLWIQERYAGTPALLGVSQA